MVEPDRGLVPGGHPQRVDQRDFSSVAALETAIDVRASQSNDDPQPFVRTNTGDDIIFKVERGRATLTTLTESATDH